MRSTYDAIVVGLGAVGSAAAYHLAQRGQRVLGIDRYAPPHTYGSTHGGSRIIRRAYFEGPRYLSLLDRAYVLWRALEAASGHTLLHLCGSLNIGAPESAIVAGAKHSAEVLGLVHEVLTPEEVRRRFPAYHLPEGQVAVWEAEAGLVNPEHCVQAHLEQARSRGAQLCFEEPVLGWQADGGGVSVTTATATYPAGRLVLCAGAWMKDLVAPLRPVLHIERQVNAWFRPKARAHHFDPVRCPVYIWARDARAVLYGFPDRGEGVKAGVHYEGILVDHPDAVQRTVSADDVEAVRMPLRRLLPDADGPLLHAATCLYTNTPDKHYLIDRHPEYARVLFASACSGHGFKASNAVGEALADLAVEQIPRVDLDAFRWRF